MRVQAGALRHRITLQSPDGPRDSVGERDTSWGDEATVSASIEPVRGTAAFIAAQRHSTTTHSIKVRYSPLIAGLNTTWRVKYGERVFLIDEVLDLEERRDIVTMRCTEFLDFSEAEEEGSFLLLEDGSALMAG